MINEEIISLRHYLHQNPEVSNREFKTSAHISEFINRFNPSEEIKLGQTGKAFVFKGKHPGKTVVFRAELDALPITETTTLPHSSKNKHVAHLCGHDGHMAILAGLGEWTSREPLEFGKLVLLYQHAEEVEQGAKDVVEHAAFKKIKPDFIFALHNIPGIEKHKVLLKHGSFSAASKGMTIKLYGKTAHAAEPENGVSPAKAIAKIINAFYAVLENKKQFKDLALLTIIHLTMGEISFGTSPGYAEVRVTLRSFENKDMELLTQHCENVVQEISGVEKLKYEISYNEIFPATDNDNTCVKFVEQSARENNFEVEFIEKPFKWSEDFSYYSEIYKTCLFGLGSGIDQPALHNSDFDFPDEIIQTGVNLFSAIYKNIQLEHEKKSDNG